MDRGQIDNMDFQGKDLEHKGLYGDAAEKRYLAAKLYEEIGKKDLALYSYNRASKDSFFWLKRSGRLCDEERAEMMGKITRINVLSNIRLMRYYFAAGDYANASYPLRYAEERLKSIGKNRSASIVRDFGNRILEPSGGADGPEIRTDSQNKGFGTQV